MTNFVLTVIGHTPVWVWLLLAKLVMLGWLQTRDRVVSPWQLWLLPAALGSFSLWGLTQSFGWQLGVHPAWLVGVALGAAANQALKLPRRVQARADGRFHIGGSWAPMVLMISVFALRYAQGVSIAMVPALAQHAGFALLAGTVAGLPTGLLLARALRVLALRRPRAGLQPA